MRGHGSGSGCGRCVRGASYLGAMIATAVGVCAMGRTAEALPCVGVYDENVVQANTVDFNATGSAFEASQFGAMIAAGWANGTGGVIDCEAFQGGNYYTFGAYQAKRLVLNPASGSTYGVGAPGGESDPISGAGAFAGSPPAFHGVSWDLSLAGSVTADEHVREFGLTVLSKTASGVAVDFGVVTATATCEDGETVSASRAISEGRALGDTFFGLTAPAGHWITAVTVINTSTSPNQNFMWVDDIGFLTAIPEPGTGAVVCGVVWAGLGRRRHWVRRTDGR